MKVKKRLLAIFIVLAIILNINIATISVSGLVNTMNEVTKGYWSTENPPEFYGTTSIVLKKGSVFSLKDARYRLFAKDFEDFNISNKIIANHNVNTSVVGNYTINYSVTDSHGNTITLDVPVVVTDDVNIKPKIERTFYSLPSVNNISSMGIARGHNHDRQMLGIFVKSGSNVRVRKTAGASNLTYTMLSNDSVKEASKTITNEWSDINHEYDYTPFIKTLYTQTEPVKVEIEWDETDLGVKELNYYYYGDNEADFFIKWNSNVDDYAVIDGEALTILVPYTDRNKLVKYYKNGFTSLDKHLEYYKKVTDKYDYMLGLEYAPDEVVDQNVKAKFFIKANAHGAGAAYYAGDHIGINNASCASFFEANWGGLHEFGHGYQGNLGKNGLNIGEVSNNIFGYYVQNDKDIYPFSNKWLGNLYNIEQGYNNIRLNGGSFSNLDYPGALYFIVNMLSSFEAEDTYREIAKDYRRDSIKGIKINAQDAWARTISRKYGINLSNYFNAWGITLSKETENILERDKYLNAFSAKDLIADESVIDGLITDGVINRRYQIVTNDTLLGANLKGQVTVNLNIDNIDVLKGKYVALVDGTKNVAIARVDGNNVVFNNVPVGVYNLFTPEPIGNYSCDKGYVIVSKDGNFTKTIQYSDIAKTYNFINDVKVQFQGYWYNDAAEITLRNDFTNGTEDVYVDLRYRGTTLFNSGYAADYDYARIEIYDTSGTEIYSKKVGGKGEMFSSTSLTTLTVKADYGYKIKLKYQNSGTKLKFISSLYGDYRTEYQTPNAVEKEYIITKNGLKPASMSDEDFYKERIARVQNYINNFNLNVVEADVLNKRKYINEKNIIINLINKMNEEDKAQYYVLSEKILNGDIRDVNSDGKIDILDISEIGSKYNSSESIILSKYDFNNDGVIDLYDLVILSKLL